MSKLTDCGVVFNEATHIYTYKDKQLRGITPIVSWMYPETYDGIPQEALDRAAERGKGIHEECQMYNAIGVTPTSYEAKEYVRLAKERNLKALASEYLVTDYSQLASAIDVVFDDYSLGDYKCTSKIHFPCVTLQLNIYRYLFEEMNEVEVPHLYVIWLPKERYGKCEIKELLMYKKSIVEDILNAYKLGLDPAPYRAAIESGDKPTEIPTKILAVQKEYIKLCEQIEAMKAQKEAIVEAIHAAMQENDVKQWDTDLLRLTRVLPITKTTIDSKKLRADFPGAYAACKKESTVKESVKITIK